MSYSFRVYQPLFESNTIFNPLLAFLPFHLSSREVSAPPTILSLYIPEIPARTRLLAKCFSLWREEGGEEKKVGLVREGQTEGKSLSLLSLILVPLSDGGKTHILTRWDVRIPGSVPVWPRDHSASSKLGQLRFEASQRSRRRSKFSEH